MRIESKCSAFGCNNLAKVQITYKDEWYRVCSPVCAKRIFNALISVDNLRYKANNGIK